MPITIYGTDWCDDTSRTRAFLAAKGLRAKFVDIEARPEAARELTASGQPITIPVVIFEDGTRFEDPSQEDLEVALGSQGMAIEVRHRTKLNKVQSRFEQYRDDELVATADFVDRDGAIVIVASRHHDRHNPTLEDENLQRLSSGLVEIVNRSGRTVEIEIDPAAQADDAAPVEPQIIEPIWRATDPRHTPWPDRDDPVPPEPIVPTAAEAAAAIAAHAPDETHSSVDSPTARVSEPLPDDGDPATSPATEATSAAPPATSGSTAEALQPDDPVATCPLTQRFTELWSSGADHRAATELARAEGIGRLAVIKGLNALWEMPLTPEAMTLAFDEPSNDDLAAMFHVLGWIIDQNPTSTMSEFQAFDDATGVSVKTQGLSLAKRPRDTIAIVDRIGPGLHVRTIDESRAREMASLTIREADGLLRVQDQSTLRMSFGWIFLYQSAEFLDTGDYSTMISGNAPLLVDRFTGALWITDTAERPDAYAENYVATGNPLTPASSVHLTDR